MKKQFFSYTFFVICFLLLIARLQAREKAVLTVNSFEEGGDGGGPSKCDERYHSNNARVVALSTRWYNGGSRCLKHITIYGNGNSVDAKVVDECDSNAGCATNVVDASSAVWEALGVPKTSDQYGYIDIYWADANY
ncbi:hypothetical protein ACFE04_018253 [Oxalis oulophora]